MDNKAIFACATTLILLLAGCGVLVFNASDDSEGADSTVSISVAQGQTWTYTLTSNLDSPTYSISGSATSWVSMQTSTTLVGTVPSTSSTDTTLVITATTTQPTQTATQTITFIITEGISIKLGQSVNGVLNIYTGVLMVTGTGAMYDWTVTTPASYTPLHSYTSYVTHIEIGEGVTTIGDYFAYGCTNLLTLEGGADITSIGAGSFGSCSSLVLVTWYNLTNLESIGIGAFSGCSDLEIIVLPDSVQTLGDTAFKNVGWTDLLIGDGLTTVGTSAFYTSSNDITFYEHDGTTELSWGSDLQSHYFTRNGRYAYNALYVESENTTYSTTSTYLVAGKSIPNSSEDNIVIHAYFDAYEGTSLNSDVFDDNVENERSYITDRVQNTTWGCIANSGTWSLSTSVGTGALSWVTSSSNAYGTFSSGTAPSEGTVSTMPILTYTTTYGDCTLIWDFDGDFTAISVAELEITSTPPSN